MLATQKRLFVPNAVCIPTRAGNEGRDFDRGDCTLLMVDGEYSHGEAYTEEAWRSGGHPSYIQRAGDFFLPDGSEIPVGKAQLVWEPYRIWLARSKHRSATFPTLSNWRRLGKTRLMGFCEC